jgi:hypothetical protein
MSNVSCVGQETARTTILTSRTIIVHRCAVYVCYISFLSRVGGGGRAQAKRHVSMLVNMFIYR